MERDTVESLVSELAEWWGKQETPPLGTSDDARNLFRLLNEGGALDFARLQPADLEKLLVEAVPAEDLGDLVTSLRDVLVFAVDTGRLSRERFAALAQKTDEIDPRSADSDVPDFNSMLQDLTEAGIDPSDEEAIEDFLSDYFEEKGFDPGDLGLPERLPPLRLPPDDELAEAARESRLLERTRNVADWATDRPLSSGELLPEDVLAAANEFGFEVIDGEAPELDGLWDLAAELEFLEIAGETAEPGPAFEDWPDGDDEMVLDVWADALSVLLESTFPEEIPGLELDGVATFGMVPLFLARSEGVTVDEIRDMIREFAVDEDDEAWDSWAEDFGDPAERLLEPLSELGAVEVDEGVARLTPLGQYAFAGQLTDNGVEVPLLPQPEAMTAFELVDFAKGATEEELDAETEAWFEAHGVEEATDGLLNAAATGDPEDRMIAIALAAPNAEPVQERWRQALDVPALRPYAKVTLRELDPSDPELETTPDESAWALADLLTSALQAAAEETLPEILEETVPADAEELVEVMWRVEHPNMSEVLELIGAEHPDKQIAKTARKSAHKATEK